jgi:hypothetical protein
VSRFLCTAACSSSSQAAGALSIDPSVQLVPPSASAASAASPWPSPQQPQPRPHHQTPLDLARALDAGKLVSATVRPLQQKVVAATSLTARLLLPPSPPASTTAARARALWVAPALEQRLVQEGAILRPSPLCSASPACCILSVEPRGPPGQLYRVVPSTAISVLDGTTAESANALLVTTTGSGARLIDSVSAPKLGAAAAAASTPPPQAAGRCRSPAAAPAATQGRRAPQQQPQQRPPARTPAAATAAAAAAPPRARPAAAATKPRPKQQQQRSPSPPSSPASPIATAPSPFGLLDGLGSED